MGNETQEQDEMSIAECAEALWKVADETRGPNGSEHRSMAQCYGRLAKFIEEHSDGTDEGGLTNVTPLRPE